MACGVTSTSVDEALPFPFEFIIEATPRSHQTKNKKAKSIWQARVGAAAKRRARSLTDWHFLTTTPLAVTIYYFPPDAMKGDIDNIAKCILDGMCKVIYMDDSDIEKVTVQKFEPGIERTFARISEMLGLALETDPPVVYIRLDADLTWRAVS